MALGCAGFAAGDSFTLAIVSVALDGLGMDAPAFVGTAVALPDSRER